MTCIRISNWIICVNPRGRVRIGTRYVWIDYHTYCGPSFWRDRAMTKEYEPNDEHDPIWQEFFKWLEKHEARRRRSDANATPALHSMTCEAVFVRANA